MLALISNYDAPTRCILGVTLSPGCHPDPDHIRDQSSKWRKLTAVDEPALGRLSKRSTKKKNSPPPAGRSVRLRLRLRRQHRSFGADRKPTRLLRLRCFKPQIGKSTCRFPSSIRLAHTADNSGMFAGTSNTDTTSKTK
jgi:hypothetical protein